MANVTSATEISSATSIATEITTAIPHQLQPKLQLQLKLQLQPKLRPQHQATQDAAHNNTIRLLVVAALEAPALETRNLAGHWPELIDAY